MPKILFRGTYKASRLNRKTLVMNTIKDLSAIEGGMSAVMIEDVIG